MPPTPSRSRESADLPAPACGYAHAGDGCRASSPEGALAFTNDEVLALVTVGTTAVWLSAGANLLASAPIHDRTLSPNTAVWMHS